MNPDLVLAVGIFIIVVALAVMRPGSVDQVVFLVVGALAVLGKDSVSGFRGGAKEGAESAPVHRLGEAGFDPELAREPASASPPGRFSERSVADGHTPRPASAETAPATPYPGAVDGPPLDDTCDAPAWSGRAPDEGDLQADELHVRQVRARDQLPARQQAGVHKRLQLVGAAVGEELQAEEDSVWWGRTDS